VRHTHFMRDGAAYVCRGDHLHDVRPLLHDRPGAAI
jgi:hypothetical protein